VEDANKKSCILATVSVRIRGFEAPPPKKKQFCGKIQWSGVLMWGVKNIFTAVGRFTVCVNSQMKILKTFFFGDVQEKQTKYLYKLKIGLKLICT